jgi:hypothetical protein
MATPQFKSRAEQVEYVFKKFLGFMEELLTDAGVDNGVLLTVKELPSVLLIGKASELAQKYKKGLKEHDMGTVWKIVVENIPDGTPSSISADAMRVVEKIRDKAQAKFFLYTDIILTLLE